MNNLLGKKIAIPILVIVLILLVALSYFAFGRRDNANEEATNGIPRIEYNEQASAAFALCDALQSGSTKEIKPGDKPFITLPKEAYPFSNWKFTSSGVTVEYISGTDNAGDLHPDCANRQYSFKGEGTAELNIKSANSEFPDYELKFIVKD